MADAMAGCHVLRNVKSSSLLLLLQFQHVKGRRRESCKVRIVSGRFRSCLTIGRERRSALKSSEAVTLLLISQLRGIQSLSTSRHSLCRRGHAPLNNVVARDFYSPEDGVLLTPYK
nr:uncharacterized protein LOC112289014 [Physcomitrium patens]|eukprot:XP_024389653.1 uncharacterized protein LOC112289014 [Physcomitrella patens]